MVMERFEVATGSVIGKDHRHSRRPNQDAYHVWQAPDLMVGVVCDGCGDPECAHSEVGAQLGARWVTAALAACQGNGEDFLEAVRGRVLDAMARLADTMDAGAAGETSSTRGHVIRDYFLFTIVGYVITPEVARFFSLGDGTLIVNGERVPIGPFPNNAPPYLAYALLETSLVRMSPELLQFQVHRSLPTSELTSFLIGSDGALAIEEQRESLLPNRSRKVGPLSQFWEEDATFQNPQAVNRRLALINEERQVVDWEGRRVQKFVGLLPDDTTLIAGRRKR